MYEIECAIFLQCSHTHIFLSDLALKDTIGTGGFAKVKLAKHKLTDEKVNAGSSKCKKENT